MVVSKKVNDAISSDLLFDEKIIKNVDESEYEEMPTTRFNIDLYSLVNVNKDLVKGIVGFA